MPEPVAQPKTVVLNVNDSDAMRFAISAMLKRAEFEVLEAVTGEEALLLVGSHEPHLVILDVHLPDANGFDVCRRVRSNPFHGTTRIVHTSAMSVSIEDKIESLESGADGFLEQPFGLEALLSCVRSLLDVGQAAQPIDNISFPGRPSEAPSAPPPTDHVLQVLDQIGDGMFCLDASWRFTFVNAMAERVLGRKRAELLGEVIWKALPKLEHSSIGLGYRRAMTERVAITLEDVRPMSNAPLQVVQQLEARALPTPQGLVVLLQDASAARYAAQQTRAGRAEEAPFVGRLSKTLRGM